MTEETKTKKLRTNVFETGLKFQKVAALDKKVKSLFNGDTNELISVLTQAKSALNTPDSDRTFNNFVRFLRPIDGVAILLDELIKSYSEILPVQTELPLATLAQELPNVTIAAVEDDEDEEEDEDDDDF